MADYTARVNLNTKALDFAQFGGVELAAQVGIGSHYVCPSDQIQLPVPPSPGVELQPAYHTQRSRPVGPC